MYFNIITSPGVYLVEAHTGRAFQLSPSYTNAVTFREIKPASTICHGRQISQTFPTLRTRQTADSRRFHQPYRRSMIDTDTTDRQLQTIWYSYPRFTPKKGYIHPVENTPPHMHSLDSGHRRRYQLKDKPNQKNTSYSTVVCTGCQKWRAQSHRGRFYLNIRVHELPLDPHPRQRQVVRPLAGGPDEGLSATVARLRRSKNKTYAGDDDHHHQTKTRHKTDPKRQPDLALVQRAN